jgi:hypothetical protein
MGYSGRVAHSHAISSICFDLARRDNRERLVWDGAATSVFYALSMLVVFSANASQSNYPRAVISFEAVRCAERTKCSIHCCPNPVDAHGFLAQLELAGVV